MKLMKKKKKIFITNYLNRKCYLLNNKTSEFLLNIPIETHDKKRRNSNK